VFPRVRSLEDAERAVASLRHAPEGTRGYGPRRPAAVPLAKRPACIVQIQDLAGVHASAEIAALPGVDQLVVGVGDLSFVLGEPFAFDTPPLQAAVDTVRRACEGAAARFGIVGLPAVEARRAGAEVVVAGVDVRLIDEALAGIVDRTLHAGHG
jgi:2-keto-3-deoxy-L-rhamnonate aldolase RhmA